MTDLNLPAPPKRRLLKSSASAPDPRPTPAGGIKVSGFDAVITYALAAIALWISYTALADLALRAGLGHWQAAAWPLIVDGLILVATRSVFTFGEHPSKRYAWTLLFGSASVSIAGNAFHILLPPGPVHPAIAVGVGVVPPVMTLAVTHLVMVRARVRREQEAAAAYPVAPVAQPVPPTTADGAPAVAAPITATPLAGQRDESDWTKSELEVDSQPADPVVAPAMDPVAHDIAEPLAAVADAVARVEVIASTVADDVAPQAATIESEGPEQTTAALLAFIDNSDLDPIVKTTARMKITQQHLSWAAIAAETGKVAPSTAMRRYRSAENRALAAGFDMPPLPDLEENQDLDEIRELVNN